MEILCHGAYARPENSRPVCSQWLRQGQQISVLTEEDATEQGGAFEQMLVLPVVGPIVKGRHHIDATLPEPCGISARTC